MKYLLICAALIPLIKDVNIKIEERNEVIIKLTDDNKKLRQLRKAVGVKNDSNRMGKRSN